MGGYNPRIPNVIGEEWVPIREEMSVFTPTANLVEQGHAFYVTQPVINLHNARFYVKPPLPKLADRGQTFMAAIYPWGTEREMGPVRSVTIPVNAVTATSATPSGAATNVDALLTGSSASGVVLDCSQPNTGIACSFAVSSYPVLNGKRILGVNVKAAVAASADITGPTRNPSTSIVTVMTNTTINSTADPQELIGRMRLESQVDTFGLGEINQFWHVNSPHATSQRFTWLYSELQRLDTTGTRLYVKFESGTNRGTTANSSCYIYYVALEILFCEEKRIAIGATQFGTLGTHSLGIDTVDGANLILLHDAVVGTTALQTLPAGRYLLMLSSADVGGLNDNLTQNTSSYPDLNALRQLYEIPSHPGVQINIPFPMDSTAVGKEFTVEPLNILPQLSLHTLSLAMSEPHVYGRQARAQIFGSVVATQDLDAQVSSALRLPGGANNDASTPDNAALDIVGDIEITADIALTTYSNGFQGIVAKWTDPNQHSYVLQLTSDQLQIVWSTDGTNVLQLTSTTGIPMEPVGRISVRVTMDVNNGGGGSTATFYTGPTINGPWTQLGSPVIGPVTSIFSGTSQVNIGTVGGTGSPNTAGNVYSAQIKNGIGGTLVAYPRFDIQTPGTTSFTDELGRVWTINNAAAIVTTNPYLTASSTPFPQVRFYAKRYGSTTVPLTLAGVAPASGLFLPGVVGNNATTPDNAALDILGDIDVRVELTMTDWAATSFPTIISKWNQNGTNQRSWLFQVGAGTAGILQFAWSPDGTNVLTAMATAAIPLALVAAGRMAVRATLDVDNGAAGRTITFYTAPTSAGPWTQLGAAVVQAVVTSIFNSTALGEVGGHSNSIIGAASTPFIVHNAQILNGIAGSAVANPNFAAQAPGTTSFADAAGRTWTVNSNSTAGMVPVAIRAGIEASSVVLTPLEYDALPEIVDGWKVVTKRFAAPVSLGTLLMPPMMQFSAPSEVQGNRWEILGAAAPAISGVGGNELNQVTDVDRLGRATYGARTNAGSTINLGWAPGISPLSATTLDDPMSDAVLIISQDPGAVTGFSVNTTTQALTGFVECAHGPCCLPTALQYNRVTWGLPVNTIDLLDDYGRSGITGYGNADLGGTYTYTDVNAAYTIVNGEARMTPTAASTDAFATLSGALNFDVTAVVGTAAGSLIPGSTGRVGLTGRFTDVNNNYTAYIQTVQSTGVSVVAIAKTVAGVNTTLLAPGSPIVIDGGAKVNIRFMGDGPTLKAKVWALDEDEPSDWLVEVVDTSLTTGTRIGIMSQSRTLQGNTFTFDTFRNTPPRWNFGHYELQRRDPVGGIWETIMLATSPAVTGFNDYEARVGVTSQYQIRQTNVLDFAGPWSITGSGTLTEPGVTLPACGGVSRRGVLVFTTNEVQNGGSNLAYAMTWDSTVVEDFQNPEVNQLTFDTYLDRDYQVAFHGTERGGESFSRRLLLGNAAIPLPRLGDMKSLKDLAWQDLAYVCVRDDIGDRWYAAIVVPGDEVRRNRRLYNAQISVVEVSGIPSQVEPTWP